MPLPTTISLDIKAEQELFENAVETKQERDKNTTVVNNGRPWIIFLKGMKEVVL